MSIFDTLYSFYHNYEMPLARVFHEIDRRGVMVDATRLESFVKMLDIKLEACCQKIENEVKMKVVPKQPKGVKTPAGTLNLSSPQQLIKILTNDLKIKLKTKWETGLPTSGEDALNEAYAKTGNQILRNILEAREYNKLKGTYAEAALLDGILYSSWNVSGTVSGRRSSGATIFQSSSGKKIGTNTQNLPKQSELGRSFRECLVARPGRIFVSCDQAQAEDWIVSGLIADNGGGTRGLDELTQRVDRHRKLASEIFKKPLSECSKGTMLRFMGKKTRHAGNYGEGPGMMATSLIKEVPDAVEQMSKDGKLIPYCEVLLNEFHKAEPEIRNTFQRGVETNLRNSRTLKTPIGRERYFFGLRPGADNSKLFKEAYSYIPQSTVGDNTGLAILYCETIHTGWVLLDGHDAITLEVPDSQADIITAIELLRKAFDRELKFENGTAIKIPVEFEMGYDLKNEVECPVDLRTGLEPMLRTLRQQANRL